MNEYEIENPLKYMCNDGFKNYTDKNLTDSGCTWNVTVNDTCEEDGQLLLATILINGSTIYAYRGNNGEVIYLTNASAGTFITRPNTDKIEEFFNSLDNFQKILLNRETNYTAIFEVMEENSFGYTTEMKSFTFPTTFGGYNLAVGDAAYNSYVSSLQKYATYYDEYFCDNLWRSMTHESIKNFDWTFTREYGVGEEEEYVYGGTRIQKTIRLFGREFDEIKTYIDALKNYQKVDYGKNNSLPDYFLTDTLSTEGWDVENIYPYKDDLKQINKLTGITPYHESYVIGGYTNGYFYKCNDNCSPKKPSQIKADGTKSEMYDKCIGTIRPLIKQYINENEQSLLDVNNYFMRMLKLNSKSIFRKKGTIQGIESLLGVFGLKSKRWVDAYKETSRQYDRKYEADYEIIEYVTATNYLEDPWSGSVKMNQYDWYNWTKTVPYDTADYRNGIYYSYQGLPVRSYINEGGKYYQTSRLPVDGNGEPISIENKNRYLFPYFSPYKIIDGNPYYQMNGGWLNRKPKTFTYKNEVVKRDNDNGITVNLFKETYRNIRYVDKLRDLINLPKTLLRKNDLCYVRDLSNQTYVIVDGVIYDIFHDEKGDYIKTYMINNSCSVGSKLFALELTVSDPSTVNKLMKYTFSEYAENSEIRIYIVDGLIKVFGKYYSSNNIMFFKDGRFLNKFNETIDTNVIVTNLFKLNHVDYKTEVGNGRGWEQLQDIDPIYKRVETVVDKFKGNNPHTGHMTYDGGQEYISYFTQLFKYALDGNQFNERCYGDDFFLELENIKDVGFEELNNDSFEYCYPEYIDTKIHYLGNSFDKNGNKTIYNSTILKSEHKNVPTNSITTDISDHIVNIKRVDINFFNNDKDYNVKYFDNVIMNYLEQILPSTLIINVNYCAIQNTNG